MANLFIVKSDGSKTAVTKEQLVELVQSGKLTPESKIEVLGRIVAISKVRELRQYFTAVDEVIPEPTPPQTENETYNSATDSKQVEREETKLDSSIQTIPPTVGIPPTNIGSVAPQTDISSTPPLLIPVTLDKKSREVLSIIDTLSVKRMAKKRLGLFPLLCRLCVGLTSLGFFLAWFDARSKIDQAKKEIETVFDMSYLQNLQQRAELELFFALVVAIVGYSLYHMIHYQTENAIRQEIYQTKIIEMLRSK